MRIIHPFHPLFGHEFDLVSRRRHWGEDRIVYRGPEGTLCTITAALTDVDPPDEFCRVAGGRTAFRTVDLLELGAVLDRLVETRGTADA